MGTPNIAVTSAQFSTLLQNHHAPCVISNVGTAVIYLDNQTGVSSSVNEYTLIPGQSIIWAQDTPCYAIASPTGLGFVGITANVTAFSQTGLNGPGQGIVTYNRIPATSAAATGTGIVSVTYGPVPTGCVWLVQRIVVATTSSTGTVLYAYINAVANTNIVDGTASGNFDIADENSPILVQAGETLILQWSGMSLAAVGSALLQYEQIQLVA